MRVERSVLHNDETPIREGGVAPAFFISRGITVAIAYVLARLVFALVWSILRPMFTFTVDRYQAPPETISLLPPVTGSVFSALWAIAFIALVVVTALDFARAYSRGYLLTDKRLIVRAGVLRRSIITAEIATLQDVHFHQRFSERLFNYGTLIVETAGTRGSLFVAAVENPQSWSDEIHSAARNAHAPVAAAQRETNYWLQPATREVPLIPPPAQLMPGWHADPLGRHQTRYWDGNSWSAHVADSGHPALDPIGQQAI